MHSYKFCQNHWAINRTHVTCYCNKNTHIVVARTKTSRPQPTPICSIISRLLHFYPHCRMLIEHKWGYVENVEPGNRVLFISGNFWILAPVAEPRVQRPRKLLQVICVQKWTPEPTTLRSSEVPMRDNILSTCSYWQPFKTDYADMRLS